jgi:hypothetical protein
LSAGTMPDVTRLPQSRLNGVPSDDREDGTPFSVPYQRTISKPAMTDSGQDGRRAEELPSSAWGDGTALGAFAKAPEAGVPDTSRRPTLFTF